MPVNLSNVRFEGRSTAYRLVQSPVIVALLDQERLSQLAADHAAASRVAAKAHLLAGQSATDLTELIDAGIKAGTDPAKLLDQLVKVRADATLRREAAGMLADAVDRYRDTLAHFIEDQAFDLIDR